MSATASVTLPVGYYKNSVQQELFTKAYQYWLDLSKNISKQLPGANLAFFAKLRERGYEAFAKLGLPTRRDDDWKYTQLDTIAANNFSLLGLSALAPVYNDVNSEVPCSRLVLDTAAVSNTHLVFSRGHCLKAISAIGDLPASVTVTNLRAILQTAPDLVATILGKAADINDHGFAALNAALCCDGYVIHVKRGVQLDYPIFITLINSSAKIAGHKNTASVINQEDDIAATFMRNLVIVEEGAKVQIIEQYLSDDNAISFMNAVTEMRVGSGAQVAHYKLAEEANSTMHFSSLNVLVERDASFQSNLIANGSALARLETRVKLKEPGANCNLNGLYLPQDKQHIDCFTSIIHESPFTTSNELYKGIIADSGRGVWTGRVLVVPDAQKISAMQTNRNLLLSTQAHVDTRPQLEIYADDVKCSHGATVGRLDNEALFYLRSRGIDYDSARSMLVFAFIREVITVMSESPLIAELENSLTAGGFVNRKGH